MAILIDMDMPTDCRDCPMVMYYAHCGYTQCRANNEVLAKNYKTIPFDGRPDWCPLREVIMCRNCLYADRSEDVLYCKGYVSDDDFCSFAERMEE